MAKGASEILDGVLNEVLVEQGFEKDAKIIFSTACQNGDGYTSVKNAVILEDTQKKLYLFIKHIQRNQKKSLDFMYNLFEAECSFYKCIVPALSKFQHDRNISNPFDHIVKNYKIVRNPKFYAIVLQDLRRDGFILSGRLKMDEDHLLLAFKSYARLHAISLAMKDQDPELFDELKNLMPDALPIALMETGIFEGIKIGLNAFIERYKGDYYEQCKHIVDKTCEVLENVENPDIEHVAILHGDCWCNNVMYAYEDGKPSDIRLVDFQLTRISAIAFDLSYFFYMIADEKMLKKLPVYLNVYYAELSNRIRELGSEPDIVFPQSILMDHWKKYSLFGFGLDFYAIKLVMNTESEIGTTEDVYMNAEKLITQKIQSEDEYVQRIEAIFRHLVELFD